jgi:choline dehydrogenase-like flavoprotein
VRGIAGLYIADAGLLPTSVGVNPMMTVIACAIHVSRDAGSDLTG